MKKLLIIATFCLLFVGCTDNQRAKHWGGTVTRKLPPNTKFVNATWKELSLWVVTRPMRSNEVAEVWSFEEVSNYGVVQGKFVFVETR